MRSKGGTTSKLGAGHAPFRMLAPGREKGGARPGWEIPAGGNLGRQSRQAPGVARPGGPAREKQCSS